MELENRMISAEWLKTRCYEICDEYNTERLHIDRIIDEIDNAPDVEVVRCCNCQHCTAFQKEADSEVILTCFCHSFEIVDPTDYCSRGERKYNDNRTEL